MAAIPNSASFSTNTTGTQWWVISFPVHYEVAPRWAPEPTPKLLGAIRSAEATRKAASDHRSRGRRRPLVPTSVMGARLQTFDAAMAARQAVRYGP